MMNIKIGIWMWCMICCYSVSAQTATLYGHVSDAENGEPILFGNVTLFQNGVLITGIETDFDGNYTIDSLEVGIYDVEVSYVGYLTIRIEGVKVNKLDVPNLLNIEIEVGMGCCFGVTQCGFYLSPLIEQDNNTQGQIFTSDQLRNRGRGY